MEELNDQTNVSKQLGSYEYRIVGYSGMFKKVGESFLSPEFFLCGNTWQLQVCPNGAVEQTKSFAACYLLSKTSNTVKCTFKLTLKNQKGKSDICGTLNKTFEPMPVRSSLRTFD